MKMKNWFLPFVAVISILASCSTGGDFKMTKSGLGYKIISGGKKDSLKVGNFFRYRIMEKYEDSVLTPAEEIPEQFWRLDSAKNEFQLYEIFPMMAIGDSAVIRFPVDTFIKRNGSAPAPWMKPGKNYYAYVKLLKKFDQETEARAEFDAEMKRMQELMPVLRKNEFDRIAKEKFDGALKTKGGTLVKITQPGNGPACDSGKILNMKYEGRFINGVVFDGNMKVDSMNPRPPFEFQLGVFPLINGWAEGLRMLKQGTKASFLVPYDQGYGPTGDRTIPPFSNLVFDVEVVSVKDAPDTLLNKPPVVQQ